MPIVLTPNPAGNSTGGKTKEKLIELTRFLVDKYGQDWISDDDATRFDVKDALDLALTRWYEATQCSRGTYTLASVANQSVYARSAFPTGATRIYDLYYVSYNGVTLTPTTVDKLNSINSEWRSTTASTPTHWMPWGDSEIKLYPTPSGTSDIIIEGFQGPDTALFDSDTEEPPGINSVDHDALAHYAAFLVTVGEPTETNAARQPYLIGEWRDRVAKAKARVAGVGNVKRRMGGRLDRRYSKWVHNEDVTMK